MRDYEFHPLANIFPLVDGKPYSDLIADIAAHGVREAVWLHEGKILDGRNRWRAAKVAGVACHTRDFDGHDATAFVLSMNLHRRHLSESQRAMVAAKLANLSRGQQKASDPHICGFQISQPEASAMLNVGVKTTQLAKQVIARAEPELIAAVERGDVPVTVAAEAAKLPATEQVSAVSAGGKAVRDAVKSSRAASKPATGKKAEAMREELSAAKERGTSMLMTYARLTLQAINAQQDFSDQERELLIELEGAISTKVSVTV